ncbi:MAG: helix-turn-helix domain-containing protein [Lachnospiraceae bacterium]|nr:helix-turn-helix domain-containing protein [Lachnospiraceae bacterium]
MIWRAIKMAMAREGIGSIKELAEVTGINTHTLTQTRRSDPGSFRWYEIQQIDKVLGFTDTEWEAIR